MDPLSDVLRSIRLRGGAFLNAHFTAPWSVLSQVAPPDTQPFFDKPSQIIGYHFVVSGRLLLGIEGEAPIEVKAGEIILVTRNERHVLASSMGVKPVATGQLIQRSQGDGLGRIEFGGGGDATHLICGFLGTDEGHNPLFAALPAALKLDVRECASRDWIDATVRFAATELLNGRLASSGVVTRLSELLLAEAIRQYSSSLADDDSGWLRGLRDPHVGRALALIHQNIAAAWSADALAREVALSRSAFMDRFRSIVGVPPIRYLSSWRLQTARRQLRETSLGVGQIAHAVGYESEEAFSRAFKREFGVSPARWRDGSEELLSA